MSAKKPKSDRHPPAYLVRVPKALHELYAARARKNGRPLSWEIRLALAEYARQQGESVPPEL